MRQLVARDEAFRALARHTSQELTQPLTCILGLLELWEAGFYREDEIARVRAELQESALELATLVDDLARAIDPPYEGVEPSRTLVQACIAH